ncbi:MAG: MgtC/SapB family protein [Saprospiraceae bacterium]
MISYDVIIVKFLLAALLGGIIGAEREYRNKSAGFRTMIMISLGACFFTILSSIIGPNSTDRIASTVVTGIGFIGAGVIYRGDGRINGITTAATIWAVSALGMGVGAGMYGASITACIIILIVLAILPFLEDKMEAFNQIKTYTIECALSIDIVTHIRSKCTNHHLKNKIISLEKFKSKVIVMVWVRGAEANINSFTKFLWTDDQINGFKVQGVSDLFPTEQSVDKKS